MREAITDLGKDENLQLQTLLSAHHLHPTTAARTHKYYRQLRKLNYGQTHSLSLNHLMQTAIIIAEQSQPLLDLKGNKTSTPCLTLNSLVSCRESIRGVVKGLKLYLTSCLPHEEELREELSVRVEGIAFGLNYVTKFERAIQYFDFVELVPQGFQYFALFRSFAWLLFLLMTELIPTNHEHETDYLLIAVLYIMVRYSFDYVRPRSAPHSQTSKSIITSILNQLFQIFAIDHPLPFKKIAGLVDSHFEELVQNRTLKCQSLRDFLSPLLIQQNYKKIDSLYRRKRHPSSIDYRLFLENRQSTLSPARHTNITPKGQPRIKYKKDHSFNSHRILTFDSPQEDGTYQGQSEYTVTLPTNVKVSPSNGHTPLICARKPFIQTQIEQYMSRFGRNVGKTVVTREQQVYLVIRSILQPQYQHNKLDDKSLLCYNYFISLKCRYLSQDNNHMDSHLVEAGSLGLSIIFCNLNDLSPSKNLELSVRDILTFVRERVEMNGFQLWVMSKYILSKNHPIPSLIKESLVFLEEFIINELIWEPISCEALSQHLARRHSQTEVKTKGQQQMDYLVNRIFSGLKGMISGIIASFGVQNQQNVEQQVIEVMRYTMEIGVKLMENKHLHQMLLSTLYYILKRYQIRFNDIILHYQTMKNVSNTELKKLVASVQIQQNSINIIEFYNQYYLPFLTQHNSSSPTSPHPQKISDHVKEEKKEEYQKEEEDKERSESRAQTRMRERPFWSNLNSLHTEKAKNMYP